ncbi:unnamed protein product [Closterium sp. NIES-65]|nr:unnamed protein product [Closterium sp. NIES-65]
MATPSVLTFDAEGRAVDFEVRVDDLQLFLQCDRADGLSLFDLTSGASPAPPADADNTVRSQWATRDAAARLAVRRHLPTTERAHFSQYKSAKTLDHFLSVCPTTLSVELLQERLLAAEKSIVAVGASHAEPRAPFFEGCSPSPLLPSVASANAVDLVGFESVGAVSAPSGRRRTGKGKGGKGARGAGGGGGGGGGGSGGGGGGGGSGGGGGGVGGSSGGGRGGGGGDKSGSGGGGGGGGGSGGAGRDCAQRSGSDGGPRQQQQRTRETPSPQQLREWYAGRQRGLYLPSFATNLVSGADLQDGGVDQFTPAGQRVTHCTCARTGRHLATFTRRPGSSLYTLTTESPPVAESGQVDSPLAPPPWSPLPASSPRYGLPCPCLWSPPIPPSPPSGACPYLL